MLEQLGAIANGTIISEEQKSFIKQDGKLLKFFNSKEATPEAKKQVLTLICKDKDLCEEIGIVDKTNGYNLAHYAAGYGATEALGDLKATFGTNYLQAVSKQGLTPVINAIHNGHFDCAMNMITNLKVGGIHNKYSFVEQDFFAKNSYTRFSGATAFYAFMHGASLLDMSKQNTLSNAKKLGNLLKKEGVRMSTVSICITRSAGEQNKRVAVTALNYCASLFAARGLENNNATNDFVKYLISELGVKGIKDVKAWYGCMNSNLARMLSTSCGLALLVNTVFCTGMFAYSTMFNIAPDKMFAAVGGLKGAEALTSPLCIGIGIAFFIPEAVIRLINHAIDNAWEVCRYL